MSAHIIPTEQLALTGPSEKLDTTRFPVRGDLAHIRLAGRCFVQHYAVPMPHRLLAAETLRRTARPDAEALAELAAGTPFDVLDISGGWCWGEAPDQGLVGYLPATALEPAS